MEICSHNLTSNSKDCTLCRVKREVGLASKTTFRRSIRRHQSQAIVRSAFGEQPSQTATFDSNSSSRIHNPQNQQNSTNCNITLQQKTMKTLRKMKARRAQINWSLFEPQRHRPRFDRWQSKLLNKMKENGKGQQLLHHMSIF